MEQCCVDMDVYTGTAVCLSEVLVLVKRARSSKQFHDVSVAPLTHSSLTISGWAHASQSVRLVAYSSLRNG